MRMSDIEGGLTDAWMPICMDASCMNGRRNASTSTPRQAQGDPPGCRDQDGQRNFLKDLHVTPP